MKNKKKVLIIVFNILLLIVIFNVSNYYKSNYTYKYTIDKVFYISEGESIYSALSKINIRPNIYQKIYMRLNKDLRVEVGNYFFQGKISFAEVLDRLKKAKGNYVRVVIPEGFTINRIANRLEKMGVVSRVDFEETLSLKSDFYYPTPNNNFEGYFFPDTYYFFKNEDPISVINKFLNRFIEKYPPEKYPNKDKFYKKLIMASIIEKEAAHKEEMSIISSVFYNRLGINMRLQSCATIAYLFDFKKNHITYEDLKIDSLYNTYRISGLPPSPISNPGRSAMEASFKPVETNYYYFVLKENGQHYFSKNYDEHIKAKNRKERGDDGVKIRVEW